MARENRNEDRKQRIRDAFQEGQAVERMPAREDMAPQQPEDVECRVAPYCRVSTMSEMQAESFEIQQQYYSEYIAKHPNWVLVRIYVLDKSRLSIRLQPPMSEERRRKASEYAKQNGFHAKADND